MENAESSQRVPDEEPLFSIPRGGPIFVPDLVSAVTRIPAFENDVFHELESLKAELWSALTNFGEEEDISVDELKVYTDEELVSEAMKIAFEDDLEPGTSNMAENPSSSGVEVDHRTLDPDMSTSCLPSENISPERTSDAVKNDVNLNKRKRRVKSKADAKGKTMRRQIVRVKDKRSDLTYLAKVEHLAKIRQKQEEDRTSVKLHAFDYRRRKDKDAVVSSGNIETLRYLESSTCPVKQVKGFLTGKHVPVRYPEVALCVEIYDSKQHWKKTQELLVLGSQALTEVRDKIRCLTDAVMQKAGEHDPSGYFLIEEVFCNDLRDPSAIDYSEPILDWLRNSKEEARAKWDYILSGAGKNRKVPLVDRPISTLPKFRSVNLQKTRFYDLAFRLGAGYLYCHQGDCKHTIVIRDMRLIHPEDVQNRAAYPLLVHQIKPILRKCSVCGIFKATKVTLDDKLAGENPCYFCESCYFILHNSGDGNNLHERRHIEHEYIQDYY